MTEPSADAEREALRSWYKKVLDEVVQDLIKAGIVTGAAIEASPVWAAPERFLIAQVWEAGKKSRFMWTVSGDGAITDHIAGQMASSPREAAKHFSLKWQMDADRLLKLLKDKAPDEHTEKNVEAYTVRLSQSAEALYDLANQEDIWDAEHLAVLSS